MLDKTDDLSVAVENWLAQFEDALAKPDDGLLESLFHPDSYWRDVLALSWNIQTLNGADAILNELKLHARRVAPPHTTTSPLSNRMRLGRSLRVEPPNRNTAGNPSDTDTIGAV